MSTAPELSAAELVDRRLFTELPCPLLALTETNQVLEANPALLRWLGQPRTGWCGRTLVSMVHPGDQLRLARGLRSFGGGHLGTFRIGRQDGAFVPASLDVCEPATPVARRHVLLGDRSALRQRDHEARRLRRRLELFVLDAPVGMFEVDASGRIRFANARWEDLHRRSGAVQHWADTAHPTERERLRRVHDDVVGRGAGDSLGVSYRSLDGGWLRARLTPGRDEHDGPCVVGVVEDMTAAHDIRRQLVEQALHDPLTGLANRVKLRSELDAGLQRTPGRVAVLLVDLDGFKAVNDGFGHAVGDALLVHVADRLRAACRSEDVVARLGGDEFAAVLVGVDPDAAAVIGDAVVAAVALPLRVDGAVLRASASVGVAHCRTHGSDPAVLLAAADRAMYAVKARRR